MNKYIILTLFLKDFIFPITILLKLTRERKKDKNLHVDTLMLLMSDPKALETVQDTVRLTFGTSVMLNVILPST